MKRVNRACKFFPCHRRLEDCTFCYCPFYPCLDEGLGAFIYSAKRKRDIWSCQDCEWIHKARVTEGIFALIRKNARKTGIIVLSHGSKLKEANAGLDKIVRAIRRKTGLDMVVGAHLQFAPPDLGKGVQGLIAKGCRKIIIVPFFLSNGNHVTRDIPHIIGKERLRHPEVRFVCTKNVGGDARISGIVSDMIEEAVRKW